MQKHSIIDESHAFWDEVVHPFLAAPGPGFGGDPGRQFVAFLRRQLPAVAQRTRRPRDRLDHQVLQVGQHVGPVGVASAPPGGRHRQPQFLAEQGLRGSVEVGGQPRVLQDAGADRVYHGDGPVPGGLDQAGNAEL